MLNTKLVTIWKVEKPVHNIIADHAHNYYELVYYIYGSGSTQIGENTYEIHNNTFAIIKPDTSHNETHIESGALICMGFECYNVDIKETFYSDNNKFFYELLRRILNESKEHLENHEAMLSLKIEELLIEVGRFNKCPQRNSESLQYTINYIHENYHEKIDLQRLSGECGYSYDCYRRLFKKVTGQSPQQYLLLQRLSAAKEMLIYSEQNCTEIAYSCGFSNSAQFSSLFKKEYGCPPKAFQQKNKAEKTNFSYSTARRF